MENEKYIVVRVCKGGGGNITPTLTKEKALDHFNNWSDAGNAPTNLFVKVFDTDETEYQVLTTWQTTGLGYMKIVKQELAKMHDEEY
jgi:hypothetical protein